MSNFTDPIKAGFGRYLQAFHGMLIGDTPMLQEYVGRDFSKSAVWAPGRMVDQAQMMLDTWRKNDTSLNNRATPLLPIMIVGMAKDYTPWQPDAGRTVPVEFDVTIPDDPKQRNFKMRVAGAEIRTQIAICAADDATARSIAMQFNLWTQSPANRRFYADYILAGFMEPWPVGFEIPDISAVNFSNEANNITILVADMVLRASVPMLRHAIQGAPDADGTGTGTEADPDGFLTVREVQGFPHADYPDSPAIRPWDVTS